MIVKSYLTKFYGSEIYGICCWSRNVALTFLLIEVFSLKLHQNDLQTFDETTSKTEFMNSKFRIILQRWNTSEAIFLAIFI